MSPLLQSGTCHHSPTPCSRWTPETVADTYVHTAARMRLRLAILVSSKQILSETGFLEPSWNRLWEPASPRTRLSDLAGYTWSLLHWWMERKRRHETVSFTLSSTWTWRGFAGGDWRSVYAVAGRSTAVHSGRFIYEMALTRQAGPGKPAGFGRNLGLKSGHGRPGRFSGVPGRRLEADATAREWRKGMEELKRQLTRKQATEELGISLKTLERRIEKREVKVIRKHPRDFVQKRHSAQKVHHLAR